MDYLVLFKILKCEHYCNLFVTMFYNMNKNTLTSWLQDIVNIQKTSKDFEYNITLKSACIHSNHTTYCMYRYAFPFNCIVSISALWLIYIVNLWSYNNSLIKAVHRFVMVNAFYTNSLIKTIYHQRRAAIPNKLVHSFLTFHHNSSQHPY